MPARYMLTGAPGGVSTITLALALCSLLPALATAGVWHNIKAMKTIPIKNDPKSTIPEFLPVYQLESLASQRGGLVYNECPSHQSDMKSEATRCMLSAVVDHLAEQDTRPGESWSFWVGRQDLSSAFSMMCTLYDTTKHEKVHAISYEWQPADNGEFSILPAAGVQYISANPEAPCDIVVSISSAPATILPGQEDDEGAGSPEDDGGRQLDADKMMGSAAGAAKRAAARRYPESSITIEEYHWQDGRLLRALHLVATHTASGAFRIQPGHHVYRLSTSTRVGFIAALSSTHSFEIGSEEMLAKVDTIQQVEIHPAPLPSIPPGRGIVPYRLDFTLRQDALVAAMVDVTDEALRKMLYLRLIDKAQGTSTVYLSMQLPGQRLKASREGYTLNLEVHGPMDTTLPGSAASIALLCSVAGLSVKAACYQPTRELKRTQVVHPVFDTLLMQYRMEAPAGFEVTSLELVCSGCERNIDLIVRDETNTIIERDREARETGPDQKQLTLFYVPLTNPPEGGWPESPPPSPCRPNSPEPGGAQSMEEADEEVEEGEPVVMKGTKTFFLEAYVRAPERTLEARKQLLQKIAREELQDPSSTEEQPPETKMTWTLAVQSNSYFPFRFDSRKVEQERQLKAEWAQEKGRAEQAKSARHKFLKGEMAKEEPLGSDDAPAGEGEQEEVEKPRRAATIEGRPPSRVGQDVRQEFAHIMLSSEREGRLSTVEAAMQAFSEGMVVKEESRTVYRCETWKKVTEDRCANLEKLSKEKGERWEQRDTRLKAFRSLPR